MNLFKLRSEIISLINQSNVNAEACFFVLKDILRDVEAAVQSAPPQTQVEETEGPAPATEEDE